MRCATPATEDLGRYTVLPNGCWRWDGTVYRNGYGKCRMAAKRAYGTQLAHRASYLAAGKVIPPGLDLDHTCHDPRTCRGGDTCPHRRCVNPDHGEPVTRSVNLRRGRGRWGGWIEGTCQRGHDLTDPANVRIDERGSRRCVPCRRIRYQAAGARYRAKQRAG